MVDYGIMTCPEPESAGCHFGTLGESFLWAKNKMDACDIFTNQKYPISSLLLVLEG